MKKLWILVLASMIIGTIQADVILSENFNRETGQLSVGAISAMGTNIADWYTYETATTRPYLQVANNALTYPGYQTNAVGKAVQFSGNAYVDMRALSSSQITISNNGDKVYLAFLLNVTSSKSTIDYFIALNSYAKDNTTAGNHYMRVYLQKVDDTSFKLGVGKCNDNSGASYMNYSAAIATGQTHLIVVEYEKIEGDNNDSVRLYINPTKTDASTYYLTTYSALSAAGIEQGSKKAADASAFYNVTLKPSANTATMLIDEIRVTTSWGDLWESGGSSSTDPAIGVNPSIINFSDCYTGEAKSQSISVTAENLTEGVTISHTNSEIGLSASSFTKAQAEAGASLTVTLTPSAIGVGQDTIVMTSSGVVKKLPVQWTTYAVTNCADIAALKAAASVEEFTALLRYNGQAIVTRDTTINDVHELYIEDASGAIKVEDMYDAWKGKVKVGDKITVFRAINTSAAFGIQPIMPQTLPTILSSGNSITPQVVTLADLQAAPLNYLLELVRIENVTMADAGGTFNGNTANYSFTQGSQSATVKVEMGNGLTGKTIPELANVIGFSFNQYGTVIVPRGYFDVEDATPQPLLLNASFEEYEVRSFLGVPATEFNDWTGLSSAGLTAETTDVLDGVTALKTTTDYKTAGILQQDIELSDYNTDDEFKMRICFKVLVDKGDGTLTLDSYWSHPTQGRMSDDAALLANVQLPNSTEWDTIEVVTHKPAGANKFCFRLKVAKEAIVILDNFAFEYVEPTEYFRVTPAKVNSFQCNINESMEVATFTVNQKGLAQPVTIEITGDAASMYSLSKSQVTADGETVTVTYHPTAVGAHNAAVLFVDDESAASTLCNTAVFLYGTAIDPTQEPTITLNPTTLPHYTCPAKSYIYDTIVVSSFNCIGDVYCHVTHLQGEGFRILDYSVPKNMSREIELQFYPNEEGEYSSRLWWTTQGGDTAEIIVTGTATAPEPEIVDYQTEMTYDVSNPLDILNEAFSDAVTYHNKTYQLGSREWQNVVSQGTRAWWGYETDTTNMAKICAYDSQASGSTPMEVWLVTPPLNFNTTGAKQFGFKVMGQLMSEEQDGYLQLWYIDPVGNVQQKIDDVDASIPFGDSERSGEWVPVVVDFTGQPLADAFYMAFRFAGYRHTNAPIYNISNVTWGIELVPTGIEDIILDDSDIKARLVMHEGNVVIIRQGAIYSVDGRILK